MPRMTSINNTFISKGMSAYPTRKPDIAKPACATASSDCFSPLYCVRSIFNASMSKRPDVEM